MNKIKRVIITIILILIVLIIVGYPLYLYYKQFAHQGLSDDPLIWASFGSYTGGILGPVLAFATFWMLFFTFFLQRKQVKNVETQKFETTFYSLLELHNQALINLEPKLTPVLLATLFDAPSLLEHPLSIQDEAFIENDDYNVFVRKELSYKYSDKYLKDLQDSILREVELSQYFRILYQLLKFIAKNNINNPSYNFDNTYLATTDTKVFESEKMYSSIVRGFVPVKLLPILALNCIPTDDGLSNLDKYRDLLERYSFLEHMRLDTLPADLPTFFILNNYNRALGDNEHIKDKAISVLNHYDHFKVNDSSSLDCFINQQDQEEAIPSYCVWGQKIDSHLVLIGESFYDDEKSIHEAIMFFINNVGTSVFILSFILYIYKKMDIIITRVPFASEFYLYIALSLLSITFLYYIVVTPARLATTFGKRNYSTKFVILLIIIIIATIYFTSFISYLMAS